MAGRHSQVGRLGDSEPQGDPRQVSCGGRHRWRACHCGLDRRQGMLHILQCLLLALMRLCSQVLRTCKLPGTWTNNLALHMWQDQPRLIVCSNSFLEAIQGALAQPPFEFHRADRPTANSIFISRYEGALAQVGVRPNARP